jgi:hypothetical protein
MFGEIPKRPTGADCKSAGECLRRFESCSPHRLFSGSFVANLKEETSGSSSVDRALAFQAEGRGFESRLPLEFASVAQG